MSFRFSEFSGKHTCTVALLLLLVLGSCASTIPDPQTLAAQYRAAVTDAETASADEISQSLDAVVAHSPGLIWEEQRGESRVRVVTWTNWDGYDARVGDDIDLSREVWVTLVPRIQTFCSTLRQRSPELRLLRLEQLLGLPPTTGKNRFVELWADPGDLVRPCPDPEINDRECSLRPPQPLSVTTIDPDYQAWFAELRGSSYGEDGYPWTRLGYTYDWGSKTGEIGLSELIVRSGAKVNVVSVTATHDYCARNRYRDRR